MNRVFSMLFVTFIMLLFLSIYPVFLLKGSVDKVVGKYLDSYNGRDISIKVFSNSSLAMDLIEQIDELFKNTDKGFLYIAMPETTWVLTISYMKTYFYVNSVDVRYFSGLSSFRPVFILAFVDGDDLNQLFNLNPPDTNSSFILLDDSYKGLDDPIFRLLNKAEYVSLYPGAYSLNLDTKTVYVDVNKLNEYFNLPSEVIYQGSKTFNLNERPPVYVIVNKEMYLSILTVSDPVIKGNYLTIYVDVEKPKDYSGLIHKIDASYTMIRDKVESIGFKEYSVSSPLRNDVNNLYFDTYFRNLLYIISLPILGIVFVEIALNFFRSRIINVRSLKLSRRERKVLKNKVYKYGYFLAVFFGVVFTVIVVVNNLSPYIQIPIYLFNLIVPALIFLHLSYILGNQIIS